MTEEMNNTRNEEQDERMSERRIIRREPVRSPVVRRTWPSLQDSIDELQESIDKSNELENSNVRVSNEEYEFTIANVSDTIAKKRAEMKHAVPEQDTPAQMNMNPKHGFMTRIMQQYIDTSTADTEVESTVEPQRSDIAYVTPDQDGLIPDGIHIIGLQDNELPSRSGTYQVWDGRQWKKASAQPEFHVAALDMGLSGAHIAIGSTSTGADTPGRYSAGVVEGAIPIAIKEVRELYEAASRLGEDLRFAKILVVSAEDHKRIITGLRSRDEELFVAMKYAGSSEMMVRPVLVDERGEVAALSISFLKRDGSQSAPQFIFLHSTRAIGGGKTDEALNDGTLRSEVHALSKGFAWWIAGLEAAGGLIGSLETTLGGTARVGRYALMSAGISSVHFASSAFEAIGVDDASWVKENLSNSEHEYRGNYATTLLRAAYGEFGGCMDGIPIRLVDRLDYPDRQARWISSSEGILRNLYMGHDDLALLRGDLSDEMWSGRLQDGITETRYSEIIDTVDDRSWKLKRNTTVSTSRTLTQNVIVELADTSNPSRAQSICEKMIRKIRGLFTDDYRRVTKPAYVTLTAYLPYTSKINTSDLERAMESLADSIRVGWADKVLVQLHRVPAHLNQPTLHTRGGNSGDELPLITIRESHHATNLLILSTDAIDTQEKRTIIANPIQDPDSSERPQSWNVVAFQRLFRRLIDAHENSGYRPCVKDAAVIQAMYRHWFGPFGNRPSHFLGGTDRSRPSRDEVSSGGDL